MKKILENLGIAILGYLKSKKALAFYAGALVIIGNQLLDFLGFGLVLDLDAETKLVGLIGTYLLGQGIADHGKERGTGEMASFLAKPNFPPTVEELKALGVSVSDPK